MYLLFERLLNIKGKMFISFDSILPLPAVLVYHQEPIQELFPVRFTLVNFFIYQIIIAAKIFIRFHQTVFVFVGIGRVC